jgi:hypothetical protein
MPAHDALMPARVCIDCGRRIPAKGSRCAECQAPLEQARQARQPYRGAYSSALYRRNAKECIRRAGGRCTRILADETRCTAVAVEAGHVVPLSRSTSLAEALMLCELDNLEAVCFDHNPRGARV